jgi:hypothetical protein
MKLGGLLCTPSDLHPAKQLAVEQEAGETLEQVGKR